MSQWFKNKKFHIYSHHLIFFLVIFIIFYFFLKMLYVIINSIFILAIQLILSLKSLSQKKDIQDGCRGFGILKALHETLLLSEGRRSTSLASYWKSSWLVVFKVWKKRGLNYRGCSFVKLFGSRVLFGISWSCQPKLTSWML